jgi:hypothetical protein
MLAALGDHGKISKRALCRLVVVTSALSTRPLWVLCYGRQLILVGLAVAPILVLSTASSFELRDARQACEEGDQVPLRGKLPVGLFFRLQIILLIPAS